MALIHLLFFFSKIRTHHALGAERALDEVADGDGANEGALRVEEDGGEKVGEKKKRRKLDGHRFKSNDSHYTHAKLTRRAVSAFSSSAPFDITCTGASDYMAWG
jgi:hypothetical protein